MEASDLYTVLERSQVPDPLLEVVLCSFPGKPGEWVTWTRNKQDGGCFWGHYFSDLEKAYVDYKARVARGF